MTQEAQGETTSFHQQLWGQQFQAEASPWEIAHLSEPEGSDWVWTLNAFKGSIHPKKTFHLVDSFLTPVKNICCVVVQKPRLH